jgi:outer membrane protein insertion porin family
MGLGRPSPRIHRVAMGRTVKRKATGKQPRRPALRRRPGTGLLAAAWPALPAAGLAALVAAVSPARAQETGLPRLPVGATTRPAFPGAADPLSALRSPELKGKTVEGVEVRGNREVSTAVIRNLIRTRVGEPFDPATVAEDYQRVYGLRKFSNVEARAEPTATGVIVVFVVTEQKQVNSIRFRGNANVDDQEIRGVIDVRPGEAIDDFRIALSRTAIQNLYRDKNYPLAHVEVDQKALAENGDVIFTITEGPHVRVRKVDFKSAKPLSFSKDRLSDQVKTAPYLFIFRSGKYDPQQVEEDVAALRKFYQDEGFFDARVGRKLVWSPDLSELEVDFTIDEGPRYVIDRVSFMGNQRLSDAQLRSVLKLTEGRVFRNEMVQRDIREIVRIYGDRYGLIYQPNSTDPDYMRIDAKPKFLERPGHVELVYTIREGKEFSLGNILVKGNGRSQDKLVYREFRDFVPGRRFNSGELQDAEQRLRHLPYFSAVTITPIGEEEGRRDLLVEVQEQRTASFNVGAGVNSNGGIGGNITFEERNFDIANLPAGPGDIPPFSDRAFKGAGQDFRASFEPGTRATNATLRIAEPYVFDQPYSLSNDLYLRTRVREHYDDRRIGDTVAVGHRFDYVWSAALTLRGEQVKISSIEDRQFRAPDYLAEEGKHPLTSVALTIVRDTTNPALFVDRGSRTVARWEAYGALGGEYDFQKVTLSHDVYQTISEDLLDRRTILHLRGEAGFVPLGNSVFFERFYGGGIGSIRGFRFRGVSPRGGRAEDPVGGDFSLTGTAEVIFPLIGENIRGVVFVDAGDVEPNVQFGTIRVSAGAGIRLILPFLGQTPLAVDVGFPINKDPQDDEQLISFSFGFIQ